MKERKVLLLIGLPASGKSTWKTEFLVKNPGWMCVSRDDFRFMLRNEPQLDNIGEGIVTEALKSAARIALLKGFNVIVDNTHCALKHLNRAIKDFSDIADVDYYYFDVPLKTCIERDSKRERQAGEHVIRELHEELKNTLDSFTFQPVKRSTPKIEDISKTWKSDLPDAIICDIDGTISHMNGRRGPFDWNRVGLDDPDYAVIKIVNTLQASGIKLIMISGRDACCKKETIEWLNAAGVNYDALFMRDVDDYRKDSIVKTEIFERELKDKYNIIMSFDDRNQVVKTWRLLGIKCAQVQEGDF